MVKDGTHVIFKALIDLLMSEFTAVLIEAPAAAGTESLPTGEVASARGGTLINLDVARFESVPSPAKADGASAIKNAGCAYW